jgi:folate-dependent phosphoribosylglycinamide formyltransferase PurN
MEKSTKLYGFLEIVSRETLQTLHTLNCGELRRPSQLESLRSTLADNNPDLIILASFEEVLNPAYSPLKDEQIQDL